MGARRWGPRRIKYEVKNGIVQPVLLERHVVREIVDRLWYQAKIPVWVINQPVGGKVAQNVAGLSDLSGCIPAGKIAGQRLATPLYIEVKRPGGARRPAQILFIEDRKLEGCAAFFAESWMDVVRELAMFGVCLKIE